MQNRPPGAVKAINAVYARASKAISHKVYSYRCLGDNKYKVVNRKRNSSYTFNLPIANCTCVDNTTNVFKVPCIHVIFLLLRLDLPFTYLCPSTRRNIRNALIKPSGNSWEILGPPSREENIPLLPFWKKLDVDSGVISFSDCSSGENQDQGLDDEFQDERTYDTERQLATLPSGDSDIRIIKKSFNRCFRRCKRLQEYFFRLENTASIRSIQKSFVSK